MDPSANLIGNLSDTYKKQFQEQKVILTFAGFLDIVRENPRLLIRNAAEYVRDTFNYFGTRDSETPGTPVRFKLFDDGTEKNGPIVGGEVVQDEIYKLLDNFVGQGFVNKLILLHGPNGSAKSSTVESISWAMQRYCREDEGAAYSFNWIFPTDKTAAPKVRGESGPIGFGAAVDGGYESSVSYALVDDSQIACKINSEFKDNPIFLIPMPQRELWLREWISARDGIDAKDVSLPPHVLHSGLSKRNQLIRENLLAAYEGDLAKVLRHVQVERFFYSKQYRVGVSTVEPQMHMDAVEKQLTMDKNIANLPTYLHNIRFHEAQGELIEANRGLLELSDLLKRPVEAFKYLLTTVEKSSISLPSSTHNLDMVFMATTNEKHLDTFKTIPDFSSFRGRFELVTVPYLLQPSLEEKIYEGDVQVLSKTKPIMPHAVRLLCVWACMTRLKQPDPEHYESSNRALIARLDPRSKLQLYENESLKSSFKNAEAAQLRELRKKILGESNGMVVYEGRFGASPREIRAILQRAAQNTEHKSLTPMTIFGELERIVKDRTVYEFLQFEPRGKYHDAAQFVSMIKDEFADIFESEVQRSMSLVAEEEYDRLLSRYIDHVVATVKKERIYNPSSESYETPSESLMKEIEEVINVQGSVERHREGLLSRIAAYKLDNPTKSIEVTIVFEEILKKIQDHYYNQRRQMVDANYQHMLAIGTDTERNLNPSDLKLAQDSYAELERRFGYDYDSARECLKFMLNHNKKRKK
jgi:predicted Ser/Thr protein kinase